MEFLLPILIVIAILLFKVTTGQGGSTHKKTAPQPFDEEDIAPDEEEDEPDWEEVVIVERPKVRPVASVKSHNKHRPKTVPPAKPSPAATDSGCDVRIRTRQDARRAFIYSEIFGRKY